MSLVYIPASEPDGQTCRVSLASVPVELQPQPLPLAPNTHTHLRLRETFWF